MAVTLSPGLRQIMRFSDVTRGASLHGVADAIKEESPFEGDSEVI